MNAKSSDNQNAVIGELIRKKTKLAVALVSNCLLTAGARARMKVIDRLYDAGLNLDRLGSCYGQRMDQTQKDIIKDYKFYLSFENSYHCDDYITEKFFVNAFRYDSVPVVWGAKKSDYEAIAPPGSFIHAEDFDTPDDLVTYLMYLDLNGTAYKEYFKWRTMRVQDMPNYGRTTYECQLCRILHGINVDNVFKPNFRSDQNDIPLFGYSNHPRVVPSLKKWYYNTSDPLCLTGPPT